ncbi:locomotion-related protein Hikaru genki [Pararge aegeria]|uniref:locomotion-related protein Hikaru genki n=1 Tax=Pararge aegeria TaxID=116150 RepID=UPI0019D244FF|nr:locomotion-related protein Hikaru genki [Pararge aegeria]
MNKFLLFVLFITASFCENQNEILIADDYKCSLPDVTSVDVDLDIHRFRSDFAKVSEVKFPGLIGPLNERLICKIKCVDGNWVGPLCSATQNGRFRPILRECPMRQNPNLTITYEKKIVNYSAFAHGSEVRVRCKEFGLYKFSGVNVLRCNNGAWSSKIPTCIPTATLTNTGDAPPTLKYTVGAGSALVDSKGELLIYPGSSVWIDCLWPRDATQKPEWNWSNSAKNHVGWSTLEGESNYRVSLTRVTLRHNGSYTCTTPSGSTHTAYVKVVSIVCPSRNSSSHRMLQFSHTGSRLGNTVHFSCSQGYRLHGASAVSCMEDGRWSSEAPTCEPIICPELRDPGPHAALQEYNTSVGGRAVFSCAWGYRLVGRPGLECESDGRWSDAAPVCVPIYCPSPPHLLDGGRLSAVDASKNRRHQVGDLLVYDCSSGYQIVGESSIVCTESGFWSHPPPFCMQPSDVVRADTIFYDNTTFVNFNE